MGNIKVIGTIEAYSYISQHYKQSGNWTRKSGDNSVIQSPVGIEIDIDGNSYRLTAQVELDVDTSGDWDTTGGTDYTVAANRAGKDFYVYALQPSSGYVPDFILSANSTVPSGYTADNSRKVAGFHGLCVAVGTISGHDLTGYLAGDILPNSVWDLKFRSDGLQEGMVWDPYTKLWWMIYLQSGTGASTASVSGGTITDTRIWNDHAMDMAAVGLRLPFDAEFEAASRGSNQQTNIVGSADPVTTGGHSDTAGRRMISDIGLEDCCGAMWQWLQDQSYRFDVAANHTHNVTVSGDPETVASGNPSGDVAPAWGWYSLPGSQGYLYRQGSYGDVKLLAGGNWTGWSNCGSRSRNAAYYRWYTGSPFGARGCAWRRAEER